MPAPGKPGAGFFVCQSLHSPFAYHVARDHYTSYEMRILFGKPGKPLSYWGLRKLRAEGVGPLLGDHIKTAIPFRRINGRNHAYPKREVDELLEKLKQLAKTRL